MLGPDDRRTLTRLLTPPLGAALDAAVGTTYTLNLDAFLVVPALLTLSRVPPSPEGAPTPLELLDSLRRTANRMTVFAQAGQIAPPTGSSARGLFAFLEHGTVPVSAPRGGVFHPKTWTLRFRREDGTLIHRVLIASRNLTFDRSWDAVIAMDEGEGGRPLPGYAAFLRRLRNLALPGTMSPLHRDRLLEVASSVATAQFTPPPGYHSMKFHALGLGSRSDEQLLSAPADRALVVAPFLKRQVLEHIPVPWDKLTVVSRAAALNTELNSTLGCTAYQLKQDLLPDDLDPADDTKGELHSPLNGLHAKLFVLDRGRLTTTFMGSANATNAAFTANVEVLLELEGRRAAVGVAKWLEPPTDREQPRFRSLLEEHPWDPNQTVDAEDDVDSELDRLRRQFATPPVEAHIVPVDDNTFTVQYRTATPLPPLSPGLTLRARPLTVRGWHPVGSGHPLDVSVTATLEGLTSFLVYEIRRGSRRTEFVVPARLIGEPPHRRSRLIAQLLQDPDRLLRYLMLLLRDEFADRFPTAAFEVRHRGTSQSAPLESMPLLERFVRAASRSPEIIEEVQRLFVELESSSIVPPGLRELWTAVWDAVSKGRDV